MVEIKNVFHEKIQAIIDSACESFGVSEEFAVGAVLATAASAVGRSRAISPKPDWLERPNLFLMIVGASGQGKSPCSRALLKPLKDHDHRAFSTGGEVRKQVIISDFTPAAINDAFNANPRGLLWYQDEMADLLRRIGSRTSGTMERGYLCGRYDGEDIIVNRARRDREFSIREASLTLYGGIQPAILTQAFSESDIDSGLFPRFSFLVAPNNTTRRFSRSVFDPEGFWPPLLAKLLAMDLTDSAESKIVPLSSGATERFEDFCNKYENMDQVDGINSIESILSKLISKALKLTLILHCLDSVCNNTSEMDPVSPETIDRGIALAEALHAHHEKVRKMIVYDATWQSFDNESRQIIKAILSLTPPAANRQISVQEIRVALHQSGIDINERSIGWKCRALGLTQKRKSSGSYWFAKAEVITYWQAMLDSEQTLQLAA